MSTIISYITDHSGPYISLGTTGSAAKKLASKQRSIDLPKPLQAASVGVKTTKLTDKMLSELSPSTTAELSGTDCIDPIGALSALVVDTMNLIIRSGRAHELTKELEKLPWDTQLLWRRQILEARAAHAKGVAKTSLAGALGHAGSVIGAFVPVVGLPITLIGNTIGILKFFAEKNINSELKRKLERITDDYRRSHPNIIQHHEAFTELHETLKNHHKQAVLDKATAEKDLLKAHKLIRDATNASEQADAQEELSLAQEALACAGPALEDATRHLEHYERSKANFDAYTQALLLIRELEFKETPRDQRETQSTKMERLSAFGGIESAGLAPVSQSSAYISTSSVGVSKNDLALAKIGISKEPEKMQVQEKSNPIPKAPETPKVKAPLPPKPSVQKEKPTNFFRLSEFVTSGELSFA